MKQPTSTADMIGWSLIGVVLAAVLCFAGMMLVDIGITSKDLAWLAVIVLVGLPASLLVSVIYESHRRSLDKAVEVFVWAYYGFIVVAIGALLLLTIYQWLF